jgi:autotransporter-associated beta strand protein
MGNLNLLNGTSTINLEANANAGVALSIASLNRNTRSTAFVRGRDLGNGPIAANRAIINVVNASSVPLVGGGGSTATNDSIVPFLFGNSNTTGGVSQISVVEAGFVTRGTNGLRILDASDYATTIGTAASDNVRITNSLVTRNTAATMNSLLVRDTLASSGPSGIMGSGILTITSGAIGAVSDLAGEELSIDNPIQLGGEGHVHLAPTSDGFSNLTLRGAISGSAGLTKSGSGELTLSGVSTFTGGIVINGGLVNFEGSAGNGASALGGFDQSPVVINAGVSDNQYVGLRAMTPASVVSRNIIIRQDAGANSLAFVGTFGGYGTTYSGGVSIEAGYLNLLGDTEPEVLTFSGVISGAGGLREPNTAAPIDQYLRITGNNTYTGGTILRIGRWELGSNTALGTGNVFFTPREDGDDRSGTLVAFGGARSISNNLVFRGTPAFGGTNALTFTGSVDLGSVARDITVDNTADTTLASVVARGGIVKYGDGRLILSGVNTYNGQTIIAAGALRAGSNDALGAATGDDRQATYIGDTGALELAGGITLNENIYFGASGLPITLARSDGNLRSVNGSNTINTPIAFDDVGTIGVDVGSTLALTGDTLDNTAGNTARIRKVGSGQLSVKNVRLSGLQIDAGQVRITPAGIPTGTSRVSSLAVLSGGSLDLTNNALILDYTGTSPLASIQSLLLNDRIITSVSTNGAAVGFADATRLFTTFPQNFAGQPIDSTTVLLIQTLSGDANLDRSVNFDDLLKLAQNYGTTGKTWVDGDFDYDGAVNFDDLLALAQNYGGTVSISELAPLTSAAFAGDFAMALSLVPEPTSSLFLLSLIPGNRRKR